MNLAMPAAYCYAWMIGFRTCFCQIVKKLQLILIRLWRGSTILNPHSSIQLLKKTFYSNKTLRRFYMFPHTFSRFLTQVWKQTNSLNLSIKGLLVTDGLVCVSFNIVKFKPGGCYSSSSSEASRGDIIHLVSLHTSCISHTWHLWCTISSL